MLEFTGGDILQADAEALVNPVNCVGVMGRGLAAVFKEAFPGNFDAYAGACRRGEVVPGRLLVFEREPLAHPRYIVNFPTKRHWRDKSRLEDIEAGLAALKLDVVARGLRSIAVPALGAGLGGLKWATLRPRIVSALGGLNGVRVLVFEPLEAPPSAATGCARS